jgi:hypothetical protein
MVNKLKQIAVKRTLRLPFDHLPLRRVRVCALHLQILTNKNAELDWIVTSTFLATVSAYI